MMNVLFKRLKSLKFQLFLVILLIGCVPMWSFINIISERYETKAIDVRVSDISRRLTQLSDKLASSGYLSGEESIEISTSIRVLAEQYDGRVMIVNNKYKVVEDTYALGAKSTQATNLYNISEEVIEGIKGNSNTVMNEDSIQITFPIQRLSTSNGNMEKEVAANALNAVNPAPDTASLAQGVIIVTASTQDIHSTIAAVYDKSYVVILLLVLLVFLFALWYSYMVTKQFRKVTDSIDHISEGSFDENVAIKGYTEIESMAETFNKMISRIQQLENSRQEFVSNVSHELKTPITSIKVLADSLLMQEDIPVELYREFMVDITEEIERENKIINDLLSLVKLDKTAGEMNISSVNINELLEQILKRLRPIAAKRNIELIFESFRPVLAEIDEVKLSLAISNLVENAIKYNYEDGWVRVSLNADHKFFYVKVTDSGVGIPEDVQDHIFERFYRVDKARSRETGGTGLGLSITRNAILMHRGAIKVYSKEKEGTTFTVRVPLNYIA